MSSIDRSIYENSGPFPAMTQIRYYIPSLDKWVNRALLFGGETGLHSPNKAADSGDFYVPPTLGDTMMFDFNDLQWTRVQLLGQGVVEYDYDSDTDNNSGRSEWQKRQAYKADSTSATTSFYHSTLAELSPPPLSGATMVTRTLSGATQNSSSFVEPLDIPQVFLLGGRTKDGLYYSLDHVWKFCAGSTGEFPGKDTDGDGLLEPSAGETGDATCDYFDEDTNPDSPSPTDKFVGRWLRKQPPTNGTFDPTTKYAFLGAGAYDSLRDKILVYGGLTPSGAAPHAVTESTRTTNTLIWEYTPPSKSLTPNVSTAFTSPTQSEVYGTWEEISTCSGSTTPTGRYGHSMAFDPVKDQLIVVGGYDANGDELEQDWLTDNATTDDGHVDIPQIWVASRDDGNNCYEWEQITTFANEQDRTEATAPYPMDGVGHFAAIYVPGTGFNTGYYSFNDDACVGSGPVASTDGDISKLLAGGAYIDLDRTKLISNENLLLHVTFIPFGQTNRSPDGNNYEEGEEAILKIHLQRTGMESQTLRRIFQPRYLTFADDGQFPRTVDTLAIPAPPDGKIHQEQIMIPLSAFPDVDRIRIERFQGSGILIDAAIYRTQSSSE